MALRTLGTRAVSSTTRAAASFMALYSTVTGLAAWRTWGVSGPAPPSLVSAQEERAASKERTTVPRPNASHQSTPTHVKAHRQSMKTQFPEGWSPPRKLSRPAMEGLRIMHAQHPEVFTTPVLAEKFRISPEAVRRILKSKWEPTREQRTKLAQRAERERREYIAQRRLDEIRKQTEMRRQLASMRQEEKLTLT